MSVEVVNTAPPDANAPAPQAPKPKEPEAPLEVPSQKADDMSAKFAALARKERMFRINSQRAKEREQKIAEREKLIEQKEREWLDEFRQSPLEALKKRGYSYEDLTKAALNDGKFDPSVEVKNVKSEIERLRQEAAEKDKLREEQAKTAAQQAENEAIERFKENITASIEANKDKYELTSLYDASELVFQTIEEHYARTSRAGKPKIMSIDEACQAVEEYLESEIDKLASGSKKFQSKYAAQKAKEAETGKPAPKTSTTLNNQLNTSAAPSLLPSATENDRIKRALAALG